MKKPCLEGVLGHYANQYASRHRPDPRRRPGDCLPDGGAATPPPAKPPAEQPPVTFKVEVNYVEIDAIVTDSQGNFVRTLTKDDFIVSEQGKPQRVSIASLVDIPVEKFDPPLFKTKPIESDVRNNKKEFDGRVFVLVLDDQFTAFSRSARVKAAASQFIERYMGANDVAAIVQTSGAKSTSQEFTSSRERLLRAVNNFMGQKERSATLERIDEYYRTLGTGATGRPRDPNDAYRAYKARTTYSVLQNLANYMGGMRGRRKAVVFFSEGIDYDISDPFANSYATDVRQYGQDAIAAATRANVVFYGIDPRGLAGSTTPPRSDRFRTTRRSTSAWGRCSASCRSRRTACARFPTRPAGSPRSTPTISRRASPGSSRTTAATTSSATTRTTASVTDGFAT